MMDVPVLLTVFNRSATAMRVLAAIREAGVSRLFIAADGPRPGRPGEAELCAGLRAQLLAAIDWPCEVKTLFRDGNLGCGRAMSSAVDWFFSEVEEGIILEDDCLPHPDFFRFAAAALAFYRADERVMCINGTQMIPGVDFGPWCNGFSIYAQIWGWACWRRAWRHYDYQVRDLSAAALLRSGLSAAQARRWRRILEATRRGDPGMDTWDFQWSYALLERGALAVVPAVNLIRNIGVECATHQMVREVATQEVAPLPPELCFAPEPSPDRARDERIYRQFYRLDPCWRRAWRKLSRMLGIGN